MHRLARSPLVYAVAGLAAAATVGVVTLPSQADSTRHVTPYSPTGSFKEGHHLVSGRLVTPAGQPTTLDNFPVAIAVNPAGSVAVIANSGQGEGAPMQSDESLQLVNTANGRVIQRVTDREGDQPTFYESGLAWNAQGNHLYATGGGNDEVYDYVYAHGRLKLAQRFKSSMRAGAPTVPGQGQQGGVPGTAPLLGDSFGYTAASPWAPVVAA